MKQKDVTHEETDIQFMIKQSKFDNRYLVMDKPMVILLIRIL